MTDRIVFLGDSITDDGRFISYLDGYFFQHPQLSHPTLINLGVSSETASGLSEPDHPFPRPCVLNRAQRAIEESHPHLLVLCYGMNDGIYYPPSPQRMQAHQEGMQKLVSLGKEAGAQVWVMTPSPFDWHAKKDQVLEEGADRYSYATPYREYNQVLSAIAQWDRDELSKQVSGVLDINTPLNAFLTENRQRDPNYLYNDGIHPDKYGHWEIAKVLLKELFSIQVETLPPYIQEENLFYQLLQRRHQILSGSWKEHVGHDNPDKSPYAMPLKDAYSAIKDLEEQLLSLVSPEESV